MRLIAEDYHEFLCDQEDLLRWKVCILILELKEKIVNMSGLTYFFLFLLKDPTSVNFLNLNLEWC